MFGSNRSIDDLLGPATEGGDRERGDGWLREWPLISGLACSLGLIGGAMLIDAPEVPPVEVAKAKSPAAGDYSAGQVVDVGEEETATTDEVPAAKPKAEAKKPGKPNQSQTAPSPGAPSAAAEGDTTPAAPSQGGGGSETATRRPSSTANEPSPAKIVNVTGTSASIRNGPLGYSLTAPTHTPRVGGSWRLTVSATNGGKPLIGRVKIDVLHNGSIVGHVANGKLNGGRFAHDFDWPQESVGHPLTVKTTVIGGGYQQSFLYEVRVKAA